MAIPRGSRWFGDGESKIKHPKTFARSHLTLRNISLAKKHVKINATQPLLLGKSIDLPYNRPDIFGSGKISVDLGLAGGERGWGRVCPAPQCTGLISLSRNIKMAALKRLSVRRRRNIYFSAAHILSRKGLNGMNPSSSSGSQSSFISDLASSLVSFSPRLVSSLNSS